MSSKPIQIGDELAVVLDAEILEALDIDEDTLLSVTTDGESVIIRSLASASVPSDSSDEAPTRQRLLDAAERVADDHAEAFEKLAK